MKVSSQLAAVYCLLTVLVVIVLTLHSLWRLCTSVPALPLGDPRPPENAWREVMPLMGTGDVLLVRTSTRVGALIRLLAQSWYNHVAIVVRMQRGEEGDADDDDDDDGTTGGGAAAGLFVLECEPLQLRLMTLSDWRAMYRCITVSLVWRKVCTSSRLDAINRSTLSRLLSELASRKYPTAMQCILRSAGAQQHRSTMNCVDVASAMLTSIDETSARAWLVPDDLCAHRWRHPRVSRDIKVLEEHQDDGAVEIQNAG